jgi:hypothetical protein
VMPLVLELCLTSFLPPSEVPSESWIQPDQARQPVLRSA